MTSGDNAMGGFQDQSNGIEEDQSQSKIHLRLNVILARPCIYIQYIYIL